MFTIMIVDDNEQLQNEIGNLLLINGYSILKPKNFKDIAQIVKVLVIVVKGKPTSSGVCLCEAGAAPTSAAVGFLPVW